eukprot:340318-Karenia_brevis.AAC.1
MLMPMATHTRTAMNRYDLLQSGKMNMQQPRRFATHLSQRALVNVGSPDPRQTGKLAQLGGAKTGNNIRQIGSLGDIHIVLT